MNKELSPLEALNKLCKLANASDIKFQYELNTFTRQAKVDELKPIIETALKQQENDREIWKNYLKEIKNLPPIEVQIKLQALKIIKEKGCLQFCMLGVSLEDYNKSVDIMNKVECAGLESYKHYTQEEFDLVKEVLLWNH